MARDKDELEARVRAQFPLVFSLKDPVDNEAYAVRRNALVDYATAVSVPPLSVETVRYQTMLLTSALVFVSFGLLDVASFKLADATIALDWKAFLLFGMFVFGVGAIFSFKAWVDYDRAGFSRTKNDTAILEVRNLIAVAQISERVEQYYREQMDRAITDAYRVYNEKIMASVDGAPLTTPDIQFITIDVTEIRKLPEMAGVIDAQEAWLAEIRADIAADLRRLVDKADEALHADRLEKEKAGAPYLAPRRARRVIKTAYEETLHPWVEMRSALSSKGLRAAFDRGDQQFIYNRLEELNDLLKKVLRIRRWTFRLEVILPLLFALGAIAAVGWQVGHHGLPKPSLPAKNPSGPASQDEAPAKAGTVQRL
ncbi:hypothetical protein Q4F19_07770 [Sphingomonas sp. BIUV-7]|uniref:Uncharacterized protein n=1 Tax=Sphingomonas natans TaxID=3063330 RepID=A0ABT8Y7H5_9SPHN|nr:hypothetical protein [Sphingomonas sp. BIUV-7]MDO6414277.1 hypothetical protein [Sphingomonas sp. BIUV-7]